MVRTPVGLEQESEIERSKRIHLRGRLLGVLLQLFGFLVRWALAHLPYLFVGVTNWLAPSCFSSRQNFPPKKAQGAQAGQSKKALPGPGIEPGLLVPQTNVLPLYYPSCDGP